MAISVTNIGTNSGSPGNGSTLSITVPVGGVPSGSLIVLCVALTSNVSGSFPSAAGYTDTAVNTYSAAATQDSTVHRGTVLYAKNVLALSSGNSITLTNNSGSAMVAVGFSAFYATGIDTLAPLDTGFTKTATGTSTTPTVTATASPAAAGSLIVGVLSAKEASSASFTQDSTHAAYATPPVRVGAGVGTSSATVAGGNVVSSAQLTYAPTIASGLWCDLIVAFAPAATGNVNLTGVSSTASAGSLGLTLKPTTAGTTATSSAGTLLASDLDTLAGAAATVSAGTLRATDLDTVVGANVTATSGTLTTTDINALQGATTTLSAGNLVATIADSLVGATIATSAGFLTPVLSGDFLQGGLATALVGNITSGIIDTLTGASATASANATVILDLNILAGASVVADVSAFTVVNFETLTSAATTALANALASINLNTLQDIGSIASAGDLLSTISSTLTDTSVTAEASSFTFSTKELLGTSVATAAEAITVVNFVTLASVEVTALANSLSQISSIPLPGAFVVAVAESISPFSIITLPDASTIALAGDILPTIFYTLTGASTLSSVGSLIVDANNPTNIGLDSAQIDTLAGGLSVINTTTFVGATTAANTGDLTNETSIDLPGIQANSLAGSLDITIVNGAIDVAVPDCSTTAAAGAFTNVSTSELTNCGAAASAGLIALTALGFFSGAQVSAFAGYIRHDTPPLIPEMKFTRNLSAISYTSKSRRRNYVGNLNYGRTTRRVKKTFYIHRI